MNKILTFEYGMIEKREYFLKKYEKYFKNKGLHYNAPEGFVFPYGKDFQENIGDKNKEVSY